MSEPRIIALLSWYDEDPAWLHRAITSLQHIPGLHHLVALDGAYQLYPDGTNRSPLTNYEAIHAAATELAIGLTIHTPPTVWHGNEVEKRTSLFAHAEYVAHPNDDWYMVLDADEVVTAVPDDFLARLTATSTFDVADVTFAEPHATGRRDTYPIPILFRAIPGLHVEGNHFTYRTPDGRKLWGNAHSDRLEPRIDLTDLIVDHYTEYRHQDRRQAAKAYYDAREAAGIEHAPCIRCPQPGRVLTAYNWQQVDDGYAAAWVQACPAHAEEIKTENDTRLRSFGLDPDKANKYVRPGPAPVPA